MITITKNGKTKVVSEPIYNSVFRDSGWKIVGEKSPTPTTSQKQDKKVEKKIEVVVEEEKSVEDEIPDEEWDEIVAEEEVEKPISEMNHDELVEKAKSYGIETDGLNNKQLREVIKKKM